MATIPMFLSLHEVIVSGDTTPMRVNVAAIASYKPGAANRSFLTFTDGRSLVMAESCGQIDQQISLAGGVLVPEQGVS